MKVGLSGSGVLAVAGLAVAGVVAFYLVRRGSGLAGAAVQAVSESFASITQPLRDLAAPRATGGDPVRAALYGREGYTGEDAGGRLPTDGEWLGTADGRRYAAEEAERARQRGRQAPISSNDGAAFGVYPSPGRRTVPGYGAEVGTSRPDDDRNELARMMARWRTVSSADVSGTIHATPVRTDPVTDHYTGTW